MDIFSNEYFEFDLSIACDYFNDIIDGSDEYLCGKNDGQTQKQTNK